MKVPNAISKCVKLDKKSYLPLSIASSEGGVEIDIPALILKWLFLIPAYLVFQDAYKINPHAGLASRATHSYL